LVLLGFTVLVQKWATCKGIGKKVVRANKKERLVSKNAFKWQCFLPKLFAVKSAFYIPLPRVFILHFNYVFNRYQ
jgi:hypothetical protein